MAVRKLAKSWQYDFKIPGHGRERKGGYRTKAEATAAERAARMALINGGAAINFYQAYTAYMQATSMKDRTRDAYEHVWKRIEPELGYRLIEAIDTSLLDAFKTTLPKTLGPKTINQHLILIRAVLRFMWKRGKLKNVSYVPMESVPTQPSEWYTQEERDQLLAGMFRWRPQWYLFYYLTVRLGLRVGEVYAVSRRQVREKPPQLVVEPGGSTWHQDTLGKVGEPEERRGLHPGPEPGCARRRSMAHRPGLRGARVSVLEDRGLPPIRRQPCATPQGRATEAWTARAQSPSSGSPFGGEPGGDERRIGESCAGSTRASFRAEHAQIRAPRIESAAPFSGAVGAACATSCQRGVNGYENGHVRLSRKWPESLGCAGRIWISNL